MQVLTWIDDNDPLPATQLALGPHSDAPGLLAAGGRLTPQRLDEAYRRGIFPWFSPGQPVLWWSPDPRMVLPVAQFTVSKSLAKTLRRFVRGPGNALRIDSAFERVIDACARTPRNGQAGTWIVPQMVAAYTEWHRRGRVHSFETWIDGELAGGLYGIGMGRMFFGESMFSRRTDASKIALAALVCFCREHGIDLIDCQQRTGHLVSMGGRELPRSVFEDAIATRLRAPPVTRWIYHQSTWARLAQPMPTEDFPDEGRP